MEVWHDVIFIFLQLSRDNKLLKYLQTSKHSVNYFAYVSNFWLCDFFLFIRIVIFFSFKGNAQKCRDVINEWVSKHTKGKIPEAVSENDVTTSTSMVIVNCIHFKGGQHFDLWKIRLPDNKFANLRLFLCLQL